MLKSAMFCFFIFFKLYFSLFVDLDFVAVRFFEKPCEITFVGGLLRFKLLAQVVLICSLNGFNGFHVEVKRLTTPNYSRANFFFQIND